MKKFVLLLMLAGILFYSVTDSYARGIGIKGGYALMLNDYDNFDNTWTLGFNFDAGSLVFNSFKFKPGIDYVELDTIDVFAVHIDWYWYFLDKSTLSPFLGFGPALNFKHISGKDDDSDLGMEAFGGTDFDISGQPITLTGELRFLIHDIADLESNIIKFLFGVMYNF